MSDYIRKADAIDDLHTQLMYRMGSDDMKRRLDDWVTTLPSADVTPVVHGKWIDHDGNKVQLNEHGETCGTCFCSRCGEWLVASDEYAVKGYFCPNCGARMDGEE